MPEPIETKSYCQCGGCDRLLFEERIYSRVEPGPHNGGVGSKESAYFARPFAVRVLTRTKTTTLPADLGGDGIVQITEVAYACSSECLAIVFAMWRYDAKNLELRSLPRRVPPSAVGEDLVELMLGSSWPMPDYPSDEWIDALEREKEEGPYRRFRNGKRVT